jgi:hypothetical protein
MKPTKALSTFVQYDIAGILWKSQRETTPKFWATSDAVCEVVIF